MNVNGEVEKEVEKKPLRLCVFGHTTIDHVMTAPSLPEPDTSIEVTSHIVSFGGTGANIARAAARLGVKTYLSSPVGNDLPDDFRRTLESDGVDLSGLIFVENAMTPRCWIISDPGHRQMAIMDQGAMREAEKLVFPKDVVDRSTHVHVGTGRPGYYRRVMKYAREIGKVVAFDPAQEIRYVYTPEFFRELLSLADIFFANQREMEVAMAYLGLRDMSEMLEWVNVLVVTRGEKGSVILSDSKVFDIPPIPPKKVVDTTGAGDAYRGGFYAGLARGLPLYETGLVASATASFAVESPTPQEGLPTWDMVAERLNRMGYGV